MIFVHGAKSQELPTVISALNVSANNKAAPLLICFIAQRVANLLQLPRGIRVLIVACCSFLKDDLEKRPHCKGPNFF